MVYGMGYKKYLFLNNLKFYLFKLLYYMTNDLEIYKNMELCEYEHYAINNELDKIKSLDMDLICEDNLEIKIFLRACEQNHIGIVKYLLPYIEDLNMGIYSCLNFEHLEIATLLMEQLSETPEKIPELQKFLSSRQLLEILFFNDLCDSMEFLLNLMPEFVFKESSSKFDILTGYPFLIGVRNNKFNCVKLFLDYFIKNNDRKKILAICELEGHHAFYTACKYDYIDMVKYFCNIVSFYNITIENNKIINYNVDYNKYNEEEKKEVNNKKS